MSKEYFRNLFKGKKQEFVPGPQCHRGCKEACTNAFLLESTVRSLVIYKGSDLEAANKQAHADRMRNDPDLGNCGHPRCARAYRAAQNGLIV